MVGERNPKGDAERREEKVMGGSARCGQLHLEPDWKVELHLHLACNLQTKSCAGADQES